MVMIWLCGNVIGHITVSPKLLYIQPG